jgi:hypothetical protein
MIATFLPSGIHACVALRTKSRFAVSPVAAPALVAMRVSSEVFCSSASRALAEHHLAHVVAAEDVRQIGARDRRHVAQRARGNDDVVGFQRLQQLGGGNGVQAHLDRRLLHLQAQPVEQALVRLHRRARRSAACRRDGRPLEQDHLVAVERETPRRLHAAGAAADHHHALARAGFGASTRRYSMPHSDSRHSAWTPACRSR